MVDIRQGGLFRCCVEEAEEYGAGEDGEVLICTFCLGKMIWRDGAWEWLRQLTSKE